MARDITPPALPNFPQVRLNPRLLLAGAAGVLAFIGIFSSYYTVPADEVAVVQRFGRYLDTSPPGLHFKLPFGIDTVTAVPFPRQLKLEFGFYSPGVTNPSQSSPEFREEKNMLTGDTAAVEIEWVVQYTVSDPKTYLFNMRDPGRTLRDLSEAVLREVIGDRTVDEVFTIGRQEIDIEAKKKLTAITQKLGLGVAIDQVQLKNVHPPEPVQRSFDEVNRAQQEMKQAVNVANAEYNKVIPMADGEAKKKISEAEGYAAKRVNEAHGDVARFKALLEQYEKAPDITRQRLYLETMSEVIPQLGGKIILDDSAKQFLPLMHLQQPQFEPAAAPRR